MPKFSFEDFRFQKEISGICEQIRTGRLVHATLITGEPGTGKKSLAMLIASALMCTSDTGIPCGKCAGCRLADTGEHPDITIIEKGMPLSSDTPRGRATIPVDDIREMIRITNQYAYEGGNRAVVIVNAESMTVQAQNCLLKILEEPPQKTYFILTSSHPDLLLTTVRSRCRNIKLIPWEEDYIAKILMDSGVEASKARKCAEVSSGSIGNAIRMADDEAYWQMRDDIMNAFFRNRKRSEVLRISSGWKDRKGDADLLFGILEDDVRQLLAYRLEPLKKHDISSFPKEWQRFASEAGPERFTGLQDRITDARKQNASNVNFQAIVEQLLLTFTGESDLWVN